MKPFKTFALTLFALALFAANAIAQTAACGGKTVYLQLPLDGWSKTTINILWDGNIRQVSAQQQGDYAVFTFPALANDGGSVAKTFSLSMKSTDIDNSNSWIASGSRYNIGGQRPTDAQGIPCSSFGTGNTGTVYIYPNPNSPSQTMVTTTPPNAYHFYFLPPGDPEWAIGHPHLVWLDASNKLQKMKLGIDPTRCGWYKVTWFNAEPPSGYAWIWLNNTGDDQIGDLGFDEDPNDWVDGFPTPFNLITRFNNRPGDLFFMPTGGANRNRQIWGTSDYGEVGICSYNFAALIYDTDKSVNPSFTLNDDNVGCGGNTYGQFTSGIVKGMVKQNLNPETRKIECDKCTTGCGAFSSEQAFRNAFDPESNTNVVVCYDMPFSRTAGGLWEFDSDKMRNHSGQIVGGFYPEILQNRQLAVAAGANYSNCNACDTKYKAESFVNLVSTIDLSCFERGLTTRATGGCGPAYGAGDFSHGGNPEDTWGATPSGPTAAWSDTWRNEQINLWGGSNRGANAQTNAFFCFESHAEFTYEKGQEFFFRGDDDIWVYMNNKLVVDLGGSHLAAPGYVNLDNLGLTEGEKYPIDIFFCDRRTTMSNIRITTNMYFAQKNMLGLKDRDVAGNGAQLCIEKSGSDGSCTALLPPGGGGAGAGAPKEDCGKEMGNILDYYMLNRRGDQMDLNPNNPNCEWRGTDLVCYGGITLTNFPEVERIKVNRDLIRGLAGTHRIYAKIKDSELTRFPNATPVLITSFFGQTSIKVVWGKIVGSDGSFIYNLGHKDREVVAGKLLPIGYASGEWLCQDESRFGDDDCAFEVNLEDAAAGGSYGAPVNVRVSTDSDKDWTDLVAYTDSIASPDSKVELNKGFTVPGRGEKHFPGLLVLWVAGEYEAEGDATHTISDGPKIKVFMPRLRFVDPNNTSTVLNPPNQTKGSDPSRGNTVRDMAVMIGATLPRAIAAYDISNNGNVVCSTCDFTLRMNAWVTAQNGDSARIPSAQIIQVATAANSMNLTNGIAKFEVRGARQVEAGLATQPDSFAHFTIRGPSLNRDTYAKWDSLLFNKPNFPIPVKAEIYDRNGNGIGDSLYIEYDVPFYSTERPGSSMDSLPSAIQIIWDGTDTLVLGKGTRNNKGEYEGNSIAGYRDYWNGSDKGFKLNVRDNIIEIYAPNLRYGWEGLGSQQGEFSKDIKTHAGNVAASVMSWATFRDSKNQNAVVHLSVPSGIQDKIPAIVVKADYVGDPNPGCEAKSVKCRDEVRIALSEPVKSSDISGDAARAPFAYMLRNRDWNVYMESKDLPDRMRWTKSGDTKPNGKDDSTVTFTYLSYKDAASDTAYTPEASDSVKFASMKFGHFALTDLEGNEPNQNEIGRRFEGANRFKVDEIRIAEVDPDGPDILKGGLESLKDGENKGHGLFSGVDVDTLFRNDKQVTILPVPEGWHASDNPPDTVKKYYPGSVGQLLTPDVANVVGDLESKYQAAGLKIDREKIVFHAKAFYHTNLGNFVVESKPVSIKCTDPVFQINGQGDCVTNRSAVYLAWNLKDAKNRWAGAGAYVEVYDFRWEVTYPSNGNGPDVTEQHDKVTRKVEMLGVKRAKSRK